jgi:putative tricarboxylic transport membrane protein
MIEAFYLQNILAICVGVILGLIVGVLPGLTISLGMIILLPLTFKLAPSTSIALLLGLYQAGMTGGSISSILLNIPGTPAAAATLLDGHPLAINGEGERTIKIAVMSSFMGGLIGLIFLVLIAPVLAKVALEFGAPEQFSIVLLGIVLISSLAEKSKLKGLMAGVFGLIISTVGMDPLVGTTRFTFDFSILKSGILWLPVMLGAFAMPTIIEAVYQTGRKSFANRGISYSHFISWTDLKKCLKNIIIGGVIGTGVGVIPGANAPVATFLSYDFCKRRSKNRDNYGKGLIEGVAAPEAANNAVAGGALVPLLTLGIPGDTVTAVLLGAFIIHGLTPGPMFFQLHPHMVYTIFLLFLIAVIINLLVVSFIAPLLSKVLKAEKYFVLPVILVLCFVGSYVYRNNFFDVAVMLVFGILSYFMKKHGFPVVPIILALILGPELERNLRLSIILGGGSFREFWASPIALSLFFVALFVFIAPFFRDKGKAFKLTKEAIITWFGRLSR